MNNRSQIKTNLTGLSFLAFVFAVVYLVGHTREMVNIITSYVQFNQKSYLNLSNLAYCLVGVTHSLLSVSIMYPHKNLMAKRDMLKITCYTTAAMYLLANVWIFQWLFSCMVTGQWSFDVAQFLKVENMMFNHMQWISRNAETIFYNHLAAVAWFMMGYYFDRNRKTVCKIMVVQMFITFLLPFVVYYFMYGKGAPDWWIKKTIPIVCSDVILAFSMFYVSTSRAAWNRCICPLVKERRKRRHHHKPSEESSAQIENEEAAETVDNTEHEEIIQDTENTVEQ